MLKKPLFLSYKTDRFTGGKLLTATLGAPTHVPPRWRPWVGAGETIKLLPQYNGFQCKMCGRVDELRCLKKGLPREFVVPKPRPDWHVTDDGFYIWSRPLVDCVTRFAEKDLMTFELPGDPHYLVPWPRLMIGPPKNSPIFDEMKQYEGVAFRPYKPRCKRCGRYGGSTFVDEYFRPPANVVLAAAGVDLGDYPALFRRLVWIVGSDLAGAIKKRAFTNVCLKNSFAEPGE